MAKDESVDVKEVLPDLLNEFPDFLPKSSQSKVVNYFGLEGLNKVTLHSLRADGELLIIEIENMSAFLDYGFSEEVRQQFVEKKIHVRELTNQKIQKPWTQVEQFVREF